MKLLQSYQLKELKLKNRMVMAPLTRNRTPGGVPNDLNVEYYSQRTSAGLIISEATPISPVAVGYRDVPGIWDDKQVEGWKKITGAVHENDGHIFLQLWHVGRISHPTFQPNNQLPVSASAVQPKGRIRTYSGKEDMVTPRALTIDEIKQTIDDYARAAKNAIKAGFDGVEIHGANGYLIDQFLCDGTNKREDEYGGSVSNRARFALEVTEAVIAEAGNNKTGIRLSPGGIYHDMLDSNPVGIFGFLLERLNYYNMAYVHLIEPMFSVDHLPQYPKEVAPFYRQFYKGNLISCGNHDRKQGEKWLEEGYADLIAYGRLFLANPDLPKRFELDAELNEPDKATFYDGKEEGYIDYPFLEETESNISEKRNG